MLGIISITVYVVQIITSDIKLILQNWTPEIKVPNCHGNTFQFMVQKSSIKDLMCTYLCTPAVDEIDLDD